MKSVVMISYCFPPEGTAGVYRPLRFVRHLPGLGWSPTVIAENPDCYERPDPGLLELVPASTEILRIRNSDPWKRLQESRTRRYRTESASATPEKVERIREAHARPLRSVLRNTVHQIESILYRPDPAMLWIKPATAAAVDACFRNNSEVIWGTGGPWSSFVVARNASLNTGKPYVMDFRDSWTLTHSDFERRQPDWIKARDRRLLSRLFSGARAVVFRYLSEAEAYYRAYPGALDPERIHIIPNGFDGSVSEFKVSDGDHCTVLYTGTVGPYWYDTMLAALARFKEADPIRIKKLRLVFVGEDMDRLREISSEMGLSEIIEVRGVVPFSEASRLQSEAHGLLLLGWKPARGHELGGSKIFSYLKAGRPIVAVLPRDEQSRILGSVGIDTIAYAGSQDEIVTVYRRLIDAWEASDLRSLLPNRAACEAYSAECHTRRLVRALEGQTAEVPFEPGATPVPPSLESLIGPEGWVRGPRSLSSIPAV